MPKPNDLRERVCEDAKTGFSWLSWAWLKYALISVISAAVGGYFVYWVEFSNKVVTRVEENLSTYNVARQAWVDETKSVTSSMSPAVNPNRLPTIAEFQRVQLSVDSLIKQINEMPAPNRRIESTGADFRMALGEVLKRLAQYDASPEGFARIVTASQLASARGDDHRRAIEEFLGGSIPALKDSLL